MKISLYALILLMSFNTFGKVGKNLTIFQLEERHHLFQELVGYLSKINKCYDGSKVYDCNGVVDYDYMLCQEDDESTCFRKVGSEVDLVYSPSDDWDMSAFKKIELNVFENVLSYRVPVVLKENKEKFLKYYNEGKIKELPLVFNKHWKDYPVLKNENYKLVPVDTYEGLAREIDSGNAIYTLRGISEILREEKFLDSKKYEVLSDTLVFYPYKTNLYLNVKRKELAKTLYHRFMYFNNFNSSFLKNELFKNVILKPGKDCRVFDGSLEILYTVVECSLDNVKGVEKVRNMKLKERKNN